MGFFALIVIGFVGWLLWTGRLQRMTAKDGVMLGIAVVGAVMAAKGKPLIGAIPLIVSLGYAGLKLRKPAPRASHPVAAADVAEARALLGLGPYADAEAVRAAHRRLIATVHPDKGGTEALAAKINAARDLLLRHEALTKPPAESSDP
ncbi:J domain-containing protein [Sphingobium algorifonticola]|uniref:Molecular chaperone DnaJ n=1 Tax=Sphingobium algorifonticola TaxID=2008318 RepID=A0A437JD60_9SPHN|nr:molecular chaperone DnaJ [Sphingobium algorifonticola]RVT43866.1 molecular chaperone DnaJ [Sphingobium algorifonticola]